MISFGRLFKPAVFVSVAGVEVANMDNDGLRVAFTVNRSMTSTPDSADVTICGLAPERMIGMQQTFGETGRAKLVVRSGYDGAVADLFRGDIREMKTNVRLAEDRAVRVVADDAGDALAEALVSASTLGLTAENMIDLAIAALARAGATITKHPSVDVAVAAVVQSRVSYTFVSIGQASQLLDEAARILGVRWFIRDGQLCMARRGLPIDGLSIALPWDHLTAEPMLDGSGLIHFSTFLDPNITPGRQVVLGQEGFARTPEPWAHQPLRVESVIYQGDTESGPWQAAVTARRIRTV